MSRKYRIVLKANLHYSAQRYLLLGHCNVRARCSSCVALKVNIAPGTHLVPYYSSLPYTTLCSGSVSFLAVHSPSRIKKKKKDTKYRCYFDSVPTHIPYGHRGDRKEKVGTTHLLLFSLEGWLGKNNELAFPLGLATKSQRGWETRKQKQITSLPTN